MELVEKYRGIIPGVEVFYPVDPWIDFASLDGTRLHTYHFPSQNPSCENCLVMLHGFTSYSKTSAYIAQEVSKFMDVFAFDQRGHGKSEGERGVIRYKEWLFEDTSDFVQLVYKREKKPVFILGGSMGGMLAIEMSLKHPDIVKGILLECPAIEPVTSYPRLERTLLSVASFVLPNVQFSTSNSLISNIAEVGSYLEEEPLITTGSKKLKTLNELVQAMRMVEKKNGEIKCSVVIFIGDDDRTVSFRSVREFYENINVEDKELVVYSGGKHGLALDTCYEDMRDKIISWLQERV